MVIKWGAEIIARPNCEVVKKSVSKLKENKGSSINYRRKKGANNHRNYIDDRYNSTNAFV